LRSTEHVTFDSYTRKQLVSILSDRVEWGLAPGATTRDQLERIAKAAGGNARDAIAILRSAARRAERENAGEIRDEDIEEAIPSARETLRQKSLDRLSDHQLALYQVLRDGEELMPKEIRTRYAGRVDDPRSERTVRKYLRKLEQYNLIASDGRGPSRVYRTVDS
jgi:Cdc6-like AAA superfamily ATPase